MRRLLAAALALAAVAAPAAAAAPPAPRDVLLRLPDLGPGYAISPIGFSSVDRACVLLLLPPDELRNVSSALPATTPGGPAARARCLG